MVVSVKIVFVYGSSLFRLGKMIKKLNLEELPVSLFISKHKKSLSSSLLMFLVKLDKIWLDIIKQVSSEKVLVRI